MELKANCPVTAATLSPFGALFMPGPDQQGARQLVLMEGAEGGASVCVTPSGIPLPRTRQGEQTVSRWFWTGNRPTAELHATWFANGHLVTGLRARSACACILVTQSAVAVGLVADGDPKVGPWVAGATGGDLREVRGDGVFAATFELDQISWVRGSRSTVAFGNASGALTLYGTIAVLRPRQGAYQQAPMPVFAQAVLAAVCEQARGAFSEDRRRAAADVESASRVRELSGLHERRFNFPAESAAAFQ